MKLMTALLLLALAAMATSAQVYRPVYLWHVSYQALDIEASSDAKAATIAANWLDTGTQDVSKKRQHSEVWLVSPTLPPGLTGDVPSLETWEAHRTPSAADLVGIFPYCGYLRESSTNLIQSGNPKDKPRRIYFATYRVYVWYQLTDEAKANFAPTVALWIDKGIYGFGRPLTWSDMMTYQAAKTVPTGFAFPPLPWSQLEYLKVGEFEKVEKSITYSTKRDWRDLTWCN
jgi:hypothetical protein